MDFPKAIAKMFGAQLVSSGSSFIALIVFARELGAHQLGVFFLFLALVNMVLIPTDAGLRGALEKRISEGQNRSVILSTSILLKSILIILSVSLINILGENINNYIGIQVVELVIMAVIVDEAHNLAIALLRGELKVEEAAELMAIRKILWLLFGIVAVWLFRLQAVGLIYSHILGTFLTFLYGVHLCSTSFNSPSTNAARSLFNYAKFDVIAGTGARLFSWVDVLVIGFFLTQTAVGAYETAWRLTMSTVMLGAAIRTTIFPQFSSWSELGDTEKIPDILETMITASLFFVIPSSIGLLIFRYEILAFIFGQEFVIASTALVILMFYRIFEAFNQTIGRTLQAIDHPDLAAYASVLGASLNIILNIMLVDYIGLEGAAIATFVSFAILTALRAYFLTKFVPIRIAYSDIAWCLISAIIMGIVLYGIKSHIGINNTFHLIITIGIGAIIYLSISLTYNYRNKMINI